MEMDTVAALVNVERLHNPETNSKLSDLREAVNMYGYKIVLMTETNFSSEMLASELGCANYNVYRRNRSDDTSHKMGRMSTQRSALRLIFIKSTLCS